MSTGILAVPRQDSHWNPGFRRQVLITDRVLKLFSQALYRRRGRREACGYFPFN